MNSNDNKFFRYLSSKTGSVTFDGQRLPKNFSHVIYEMFPYVSRVSQCYSCFRFGHVKANCKSSARCANCGEKRHEDNSPCTLSELPQLSRQPPYLLSVQNLPSNKNNDDYSV
ncbi:unnamed protein product [Lasius platythorax]|uniref:CCHC-type domain-containing protein n=1 Tax=Lasius platythorax TaxID=488582 RepID=A0AAV2NRB3_9HYME